MKKHHRTWILPFDERLIPDLFSFKYPKSPWVRLFLFMEMVCAIIVVIGTLLLVVLTAPNVSGTRFQEEVSTSSANPQ